MAIFKHTQRSFFDVYSPLVAAYPKFPDWLWSELAGGFEVHSELMNNIATDIMDPVTRESAYAFARQNDYDPVESDGATAEVTITLTAAFAKTLNAGYQVSGISNATGQLNIYELTANASSGGTDTITADTKQKETNTNINIGTILSNDDYLEVPIDGYTGIISTSISLTINALAWTRVNNFDNSITTDRHFIIIYQSNGKARVQFGDGVTGLKPPLNEAVFATFEITKGTLGRMDVGTIIINTGGDPDIQSLTNAVGSSGGNDSEGISSIVRNARQNVRLRDAIFYQDDLETAARAASSSVIKALGLPGVGLATIQIVPAGGGLPSGGLKTAVDDYVTALTLFGVIPIQVDDPSYNQPVITATATVRSGFSSPTVLDLVEFGLTMVSTAIDNEVIEYYQDNGIDSTRTVKINPIFGFTFVSDDNEALEFIINQWVALLGTLPYRQWGQTLEVGDLWIMGNSLFDFGVDVFQQTAPITNVVPLSTEIIEFASVTVT